MADELDDTGENVPRAELDIVDDQPRAQRAGDGVWTLLIVDDEQEVHEVTMLALKDFHFAGRPLRFLHAYSGEQARQIMTRERDVALILMDVVMESDQAGLDAVHYIRETLNNRFVRIILRTGQPGQAPEYEVITGYDINDYKQKTELTRKRMFTVVYTSLSAYRDLTALEANRRGLEKVIEASSAIFEYENFEQFAQGVLEQLAALLFFGQDAMVLSWSGLSGRLTDGDLEVLAAIGRYQGYAGRYLKDVDDFELRERLLESVGQQDAVFGDNYFISTYRTGNDNMNLVYVSGEQPLSVPDQKLVSLFCRNVTIAQKNLQRFQRAQAGDWPDKQP